MDSFTDKKRKMTMDDSVRENEVIETENMSASC